MKDPPPWPSQSRQATCVRFHIRFSSRCTPGPRWRTRRHLSRRLLGRKSRQKKNKKPATIKPPSKASAAKKKQATGEKPTETKKQKQQTPTEAEPTQTPKPTKTTPRANQQSAKALGGQEECDRRYWRRSAGSSE